MTGGIGNVTIPSGTLEDAIALMNMMNHLCFSCSHTIVQFFAIAVPVMKGGPQNEKRFAVADLASGSEEISAAMMPARVPAGRHDGQWARRRGRSSDL